jgi:hypothetical protein
MMTEPQLKARRVMYERHADLLEKARHARSEKGAGFWHGRADMVQRVIDLMNSGDLR